MITLVEWRKKKGYTQEEMAEKLQEFARAHRLGDQDLKLSQRTYCYWEKGTQPRRFWMRMIHEFTNNRVNLAAAPENA